MIDYKGVDFSKILKRYDVEAQNETTPEAVAKKMLPADPVLKNVAECVLYMKFKDVGPATSEALKTHKPLDIINNGLVVGMECVAKLYAEHIYYLPARNRSPAEGRPKPPSSCTLPRETPTTSERTSPLLC